jgi:CheY-like chemotaxis protein
VIIMAKIMVVDDEKDIRLSVKSILRSQGYQVVLASNADECLKLVKKEKPDLILMDILMPGTSVNDILPKLNKFKIIIFSVVSLAEKKVVETGRAVPHSVEHDNVVDYLSKPFSMKDLLSKVKNALAKK